MDRRVVVTGASSGIGAATVRLFRERGWEVVAVARRRDRLEALAAETGAEYVVTDLTDARQVDALRDSLAASGPVHALVNNAGGALGLDSVEASDPEDWRRMFEINVLSVKLVTSALLPLLRAGVRDSGSSADIVTVTSIAGHVAYEGGGGYNAAKFAAHALVAVLRLELAGEPIRVVEIAPGWCTPRSSRSCVSAAIEPAPTPSTPRCPSRWSPRTSRPRSSPPSSCPAREPRPRHDQTGRPGRPAQGGERTVGAPRLNDVTRRAATP